MAGSNSKKFATKCQQKTTHQNNSPDKQFGFGIHPRSVNMEDDALPVSRQPSIFSWMLMDAQLKGFMSSSFPANIFRFRWNSHVIFSPAPSLYQLQCNFSIHSIVSQDKFLETLEAAEHRKEGRTLIL